MLGTVHCSEFVQSSLVFVFCFVFILKFEWVYGNMFVVVFDGLNLKLFAELTVMGWITVFCRMKEKFYYVMCVHWTVFAATASAATTTTADIHTLYKYSTVRKLICNRIWKKRDDNIKCSSANDFNSITIDFFLLWIQFKLYFSLVAQWSYTLLHFLNGPICVFLHTLYIFIGVMQARRQRQLQFKFNFSLFGKMMSTTTTTTTLTGHKWKKGTLFVCYVRSYTVVVVFFLYI